MFFSKRAFNTLSSSSRCSGGKSLFFLFVFRALVAFIVAASGLPTIRALGAHVHLLAKRAACVEWVESVAWFLYAWRTISTDKLQVLLRRQASCQTRWPSRLRLRRPPKQ